MKPSHDPPAPDTARPLPIPTAEAALRAENAALREELDLLGDALERMPHGLCAFDGRDKLVLANAHYRKIWSLPHEVVRPGATFRQIMDATPGRETTASRSRPAPAPGSEGTRWREWQLDDGRLIEIVVSRRADGSCVALWASRALRTMARTRRRCSAMPTWRCTAPSPTVAAR